MQTVGAATVQVAVAHLTGRVRLKQAVRRAVAAAEAGMPLVGSRDVPIDTHYRLLPLRVRELAKVDLPHALSRGSAEDRDDAESDAPRRRRGEPRGIDNRRWKEALAGRRFTYREVAVDATRPETLLNALTHALTRDARPVARGCVVGEPGGGKSTLTRALAWYASTRSLPVAGQLRELIPARVELRTWQSTHPTLPLPRYLAQTWAAIDSGTSRRADEAQWIEWLRRGEVLLLIDGLDELEPDADFAQRVQEAVGKWPACGCLVTCRTISFEQYDRYFEEGFPVVELGGLTAAELETFIRRFPTTTDQPLDAPALLAHLDQRPQLLPLLGNPLLVSLVCVVAAQLQPGEELPETRGELYARVVQELLRQRRPGARPVELAETLQLQVIAQAALGLFEDAAQRHLVFDETALVTALKVGARIAELGDVGTVANALYLDLTLHTRLLHGQRGTPRFAFLHPTVHEYLAAVALAELANTHGWDRPITIAGQPISIAGYGTVADFIDAKAGEARWHEVFTLLAGQLADPAPLLSLLADPARDYLTHDRLALAAWCLAEIRPARRERVAALSARIGRRALELWWAHHKAGTGALLTTVRESFAALGAVTPRIDGKPFIDHLVDALRDPDGDVRRAAVEAVGGVGSAAATHPTFLDRLADLLRNPDILVRWAAADAVGGVGSAAATHPTFLDRLADLLRDPDRHVRWAAAEAVGGVGSAAATHPTFLDRLADLLRDPDRHVRRAAAEAVGGVGSAAATHPTVLDRIADLLREPDADVRRAAAEAVGGVGSATATHPTLLDRLANLLRDPDADVRVAAAEAVGGVGSAAATHPTLLDRLANLLRDPDADVRGAAVRAVAWVGGAAATHPTVLDHLADLLRNPDANVRRAAAEAVGGVGSAAATHPTVLDRLADLLREPDADVRRAAAEAVGGVGSAAATHPTVLDRLADLLREPDADVRRAAAEAVGGVGSAAATHPTVLDRLADLLREPDAGMQIAAAKAVGGVGSAAATHPTVLDRLADLLCKPDILVQWVAAKAVGGVGSAAATHPTVLDRLADLLRDPDANVRRAAAKAVGGVGSEPATHPTVLDRLADLLRDPDANVRRAAADAVGGVGSAAATHPTVLDRLADLLRDPHADVRGAAASAIQEMQRAGVRIRDNNRRVSSRRGAVPRREPRNRQ